MFGRDIIGFSVRRSLSRVAAGPDGRFLGVLLVLGFLLVPSNSWALSELSGQEMSEVTGREGAVVDIHSPNSFQTNEITYGDADGSNLGFLTGTSGTLVLNNVCIYGGASCGSAFNATDISIDADGSQAVGGSNRGAIIVSYPTLNGSTTLEVGDIFPGNDASSPMGNATVVLSSFPNGQVEIGSRGAGIIADFDLNFDFDSIRYFDSDGNATGNGGYLGLNNVTVTKTSGTEMTGLTMDVDGSTDLDGTTQGAVHVGMPSGNMDVSVDEVRMGPNDSTGNVGQLDVQGIDASGLEMQVGSH